MPEDNHQEDAARMQLGPDAVHESDNDGEQYFDCPSCGAPVTVTQIIEEGRCSGALDAEVAESYTNDTAVQDTGCTADLALEMVWKA